MRRDVDFVIRLGFCCAKYELNRMSAFVDIFCKEINGSDTEIICIDGKAMRGTVYENGRNPDIVSAIRSVGESLWPRTYAKRRATR